MTFPTTPALAFTASVSTITAATANAWRSYFPKALDAVGGGVYTNLAEIEFPAGSSGWKFGALVTLDTTSTVLFQAGGTFTINSDPSLFGTMRVGVGGAGGSVRFYATSTLQVDDTVAMSIAGDATWTGASTQVHANLSTDTYSAGSVLAINTASATLGTAATLTVNGAAGGGNTATVAFGQYSTITIASGAAVTATIGGGSVTSTITIGADGDLIRASGSTDTYQSGSALTTNTGSLVNLNIGKTNAGTITYGSLAVISHESSSTETYDSGANLTFNNAITRSGKVSLSGTGAYTEWRLRNAPDADDAAVDGKAYDIVSITMTSGASKTFVLNNGPAGKVIRFQIQVFAAGGEFLNVNNFASGLIYSIVPGAAKVQTVEFIWNGGSWSIGMVGAAVSY